MRRGQADPGLAAALIITVGLITLLYVLFLPPADRAALLEGNVSPPAGTGSISPLQETLLDEHPGVLNALREPSFRHRLNDAYLTSVREDRRLASREDVLLTSSYRDERVLTLPLRVSPDERVARVVLVLSDVTALNGRPLLYVYVDGKLLTGKRIGGVVRSITIPIPSDMLEDAGEHTITLRLESPPWYAFWRSYEVRIDRVELLGSVVDERAAQSLQTVTLAPEEYAQVKSAYLILTPSCHEPPRLVQVVVNGETLLSTPVRCGSPLRVDIPPRVLRVGENSVWLRVYDGTLRLDSPTLVTVLREPIQPVYYFRITDLAWGDIQAGKRKVLLRIEIPRFSRASVDVSVNGMPRYAVRETVTLDITRDVREGENYIQLVPRVESEISRLTVYTIASS